AAGVGLLEDTVTGLVTRMLATMEGEQQELDTVIREAGADGYDVQALTAEPMSFDVGGLKLTVRQYRGRGAEAQESLVAMLPGQVLGSFADYLVASRLEGTYVFARGDDEVAVLFLARAGTSTEGNVSSNH
ncbi:MAG: hypothetical protein WCY60_04920, partial [Trueperaceae bacterium]